MGLKSREKKSVSQRGEPGAGKERAQSRRCCWPESLHLHKPLVNKDSQMVLNRALRIQGEAQGGKRGEEKGKTAALHPIN